MPVVVWSLRSTFSETQMCFCEFHSVTSVTCCRTCSRITYSRSSPDSGECSSPNGPTRPEYAVAATYGNT